MEFAIVYWLERAPPPRNNYIVIYNKLMLKSKIRATQLNPSKPRTLVFL